MKKAILLLSITTIMLLSPASALAADVMPNNLLISLWPEYNNNQVFFMQQVEIPGDTPLPVTVRFAFPTDAQVQWTGEILGTDISKDIQATPTVTQKNGYSEVAITLTKSRIGQAEAVWNGLKTDGRNRLLTVEWIQRYDARTTTFEFLQPSQSSDVVMTPKPTGNRQSPEGFTFYETAPKRIPVGQTATFSVSYKRAVATPSVNDAKTPKAAPGQTAGAAQNPVNYWILAAVFLIIGAVGIWYVYSESKKQ